MIAYSIIDLKLDNILIGFEDPSVMEDFILKQTKNPMKRTIRDCRCIYRSHNDFGPPRSFGLLPKITDFGLAQSGAGPGPLMHPIQPALFHAPEVILGTSWSYSVDIWNLGLLVNTSDFMNFKPFLHVVIQVWELVEGEDLFQHVRSSQGDYDVRAHLAEMIALLGAPPQTLIDREISWSEVKRSHAVPNSKGKLSQTAREYYGGPFFTPEGKFKHESLIPSVAKLEDFILSFEGEERQVFLDFIKNMLQWMPEDRKTAKELLQHPWVRDNTNQ